MNRRLIYVLIFTIGMITGSVAICALFSRMQYMVYRLERVSGVKPCGEGQTFCLNTSSQPQFDGMTLDERRRWVQSQSAYVAMAMSLVSGIVGLFTIMPLGLISDKYGRKCALLIAYTGFAIEMVINALVMLLDWPLWVLIVSTLPSSILGNGLFGILTQIYVCITDLTEQKATAIERKLSVAPHGDLLAPPMARERKRTLSIMEMRAPKSVATVQSSMTSERLSIIALFEGCIGLVTSIGTMIMGPIIENFGLSVPSWVVITLTAVNLVNCALIPNTRLLWCPAPRPKPKLSLQQDDSQSRSKLLSVSSKATSDASDSPAPLKAQKSCCFAMKKGCAFVTVPIIIGTVTMLLGTLIAMTDLPVLNLYFIGAPYNMTIGQVGLAVGMRNIGCSIVSGLFVLLNMFYLQAKLASSSVDPLPAVALERVALAPEDASHNEAVPVVVKRAKMNEARRMIIFMLAGVLLAMSTSRFLYGISNNFGKPTCYVLLFIGMILNAFQFYGPLIRALLSSMTPSDVQGRLYALLGCADALGSFVGLTTLPAFFASTVFIYAGLVFHMAAFILFVAFILTL